MPELSAFSTPAMQVDFPNDANLQGKLDAAWSTNVESFTQQAICGNPWTAQYASQQTSYYNPLETDIPGGTAAVLVSWVAFPNRLRQYLGQGATPPNPYGLSQTMLYQLADTGSYDDNGTNTPLPNIPVNPCGNPLWNGETTAYGPYGPRGWQDEYCEWSVTRDGDGNILRVDFTCENPEY